MSRSAFVRQVGVAALAGAIAGALAGLGSRVAMRISALAGGPAVIGMRTENGNQVGEITLAGTLFLALYVGFSFGVYGGLLYAALRPWLARLGAWRGAAFGALLLAAFGSTTIQAANADFRLFGPPLLNVISFSALFVLFGVAIAPLADRLERLSPGRGASVLLGVAAVVGTLILVITNAALLQLGLSGLGPASAVSFARGFLLLDLLLVVALAARWLGRRRPGLATGTYAVLAVPVLVGLVLSASEIAAILR